MKLNRRAFLSAGTAAAVLALDHDSCLGVFPRPEKKQNRCYVILRSRIVHLN
jgi:hypothetical protein